MTLQQYTRHARLYGTDCVYPTAVAEGDLSAREMVDLKLALQDIASDHRKAKKPPSWADDVPRVDETDVLALDREGFTTSEIVAHTKFSLDWVEKVLAPPPVSPLVEANRRRPSTDVAGWDVEVMKDPSVHAGSRTQFSQYSENTTSGSDSADSAKNGGLHGGLHSPAAKAKAAATRARRQAQKDADIIRLRQERQMVPGGIAKTLGVGEARVRKVLRAQGLL